MDYTSEFTGPQIDERLGLAGTAYQRPETGIPAEDLSEGVQEALDKADHAYIMPEGGIPAEDIADGVIPQDVAHKVSGATSGNFAALNAQGDLEDSGKKASDFGSAADVEAINEKIPTQASSSNQLADKAFVNSSVQTATANFRGSYDGLGYIPTDTIGYPADYAGSKKPTVNDYMVVLDTKATYWQSGRTYNADSDTVFYFNEEELSEGLYLCIESLDESLVNPATDTEHWRILPRSWMEPANLGGTWRFKYSGDWDRDNINGWIPEYQVNEEPLTAAQVAALNSNITESLTNKLVALPSKPVDTASQALSEEEKAQARTNIGATAPEVFLAVYGTTPYADIVAAYNAGKLVLCFDSSCAYRLESVSGAQVFFSARTGQLSFNQIVVTSGEVWSVSWRNVETSSSRVTSLSASSTDNQYPSAKAVYDFVKALADANGLTMP